MSAKKSRFGKKGKKSQDMSLQITSMADIFTIILVFLLKGFSTGAVNITPVSGLLLARSKSTSPAAEMMKIEIFPQGVQVEGKLVTRLRGFQFETPDLTPQNTSQSLEQVLSQERMKDRVTFMQRNPSSEYKPESKLMVLVDRKTPYATLTTVLASVATHGYTDFKLVVLKDE